MENINPSQNVNLTNSPETLSQVSGYGAASIAEEALEGELGGLKVEVTESLPRNFSSLTDASSFGSTSDLSSKGGNVSSHKIVQIHPSSTSTSLTTIDSSLSLTSDEDSDLGKSEIKRSLLEQKIKDEETITFSAPTKGYVELNESQSRYVKNLHRALMAMDNKVPQFMDEATRESINIKVNLAAGSIVQLAGNIKELSHEKIISRLEGKPPSFTGALGEAQEAIEHYLDCIKDLQTGESKKASIDFCLAKKCESRFKEIEARETGNQKASDLYNQSFRCYEEAVERNDFHEVSRALERAGDNFSNAAEALENKRPDISQLYEKAGVCFQQKSQCYKSTKSMEAMTFADYQKTLYLTKAGTSFLSAANAAQAGKSELVELFQAAGSCFRDAVQKLSKGGSQAWKQFQFLEQAGDHFVDAAEVMNGGEVTLAGLQQLLGRSRKAAANAINVGNSEALRHCQHAYRMLTYALKEYRKKDLHFSDIHQKIGICFYEAGQAFLKGDEKRGRFCARVASSAEENFNASQHPISPEAAVHLQDASNCFLKAGDKFRAGKEEIAILYEQLGECNRKEAYAQNSNVKNQLDRVARSYYKIIEKKNKGFQEEDAALQFFRSVAMYSKTAAEEIERSPHQDEETLASLNAASFNLYLAAKEMEQGDQELSTAYENYAASHHYLAIARNPALLERFPARFQAGFKKESVPNLSLIKYWKNATKANYLKIEKLFKERRKTLDNVVAANPIQASAGII